MTVRAIARFFLWVGLQGVGKESGLTCCAQCVSEVSKLRGAAPRGGAVAGDGVVGGWSPQNVVVCRDNGIIVTCLVRHDASDFLSSTGHVTTC